MRNLEHVFTYSFEKVIGHTYASKGKIVSVTKLFISKCKRRIRLKIMESPVFRKINSEEGKSLVSY
ncbi:hypothetical protein WIW90_08420 [Sulfolobaceae archaeon RB850M]|jgi:hypothetical protein